MNNTELMRITKQPFILSQLPYLHRFAFFTQGTSAHAHRQAFDIADFKPLPAGAVIRIINYAEERLKIGDATDKVRRWLVVLDVYAFLTNLFSTKSAYCHFAVLLQGGMSGAFSALQ